MIRLRLPGLLLALFITACDGGGRGGPPPPPPPLVQHVLLTQLSPGVQGSRGAGESTHDQGSSVSYSFGAAAGYERLIVTLDGSVVGASGTVAMNGPRVLTAT